MKQKTRRFYLSATGALCILLAGCNEPMDIAGGSPATVSVGAHVDDAIISAKVSAALLASDDIKAFDIKVSVRKGEVMLSGFVDNKAQINHSISLVRRVEGVNSVDNKLMLKNAPRSLGNKIDDGVVTAKVKSALLADQAIKSMDISVVTSKGDVQLSGFVDSKQQILRAIEVAEKVEGVQHITNQLSVQK